MACRLAGIGITLLIPHWAKLFTEDREVSLRPGLRRNILPFVSPQFISALAIAVFRANRRELWIFTRFSRFSISH